MFDTHGNLRTVVLPSELDLQDLGDEADDLMGMDNEMDEIAERTAKLRLLYMVWNALDCPVPKIG